MELSPEARQELKEILENEIGLEATQSLGKDGIQNIGLFLLKITLLQTSVAIKRQMLIPSETDCITE